MENKTPATFFYYSKSADKQPGKGAGETLGTDDCSKYAELQGIKDWRKILSNFHEEVFEFNGKRFRTVEHVFQSAKISISDADKGELFSLDSGSLLSNGDGELARKNRKMVLLNKSQLAEWSQKQNFVLEGALKAKFSQVAIAKRALLATMDAELWHGTRGVPKTRQIILEKVRESLRMNAAPDIVSSGDEEPRKKKQRTES